MTLVNMEHNILYREHKHHKCTSTPLKIRNTVRSPGVVEAATGYLRDCFSDYLYLVVLIR
jgi:hypothetical protein